MKRELEIQFLKFLDEHRLKSKSILLGLSGGPDSLALFYLMLKMSRKNSTSSSFSFAVAHIDHSWRKESADEAAMLKELVEGNGIPFYCKTLDRQQFIGHRQNMEDVCRTLRLNFFRTLCVEKGYDGVILGHHQDDQSETVLKRILEGSSFLNFTGMKPISYIDGLKVLRPLLGIKKRDVLEYLRALNKSYFDDFTNRDPRFLRSRMRESILPTLSQQFGKEISSNLTYLSDEIQELQIYLDQTFTNLSKKIVTTPTQTFLDLNEGIPSSDFELKYLIRKFCDHVKMPLTRAQLQTLIPLIRNRLTGKKIIHRNKCLRIYKSKIYFEQLHERNDDSYLETNDFAVDAQ